MHSVRFLLMPGRWLKASGTAQLSRPMRLIVVWWTVFRPCRLRRRILILISQLLRLPMARVLIVDDDPDHCDLLARMLHRIGLETVTASNGAKCTMEVAGSSAAGRRRT